MSLDIGTYGVSNPAWPGVGIGTVTGGGESAAQDTPTFWAPLTVSLVPYAAVGDGTPTFTRATTAYQTDFEGKQNLVLSGEARMQGARRVVNVQAGSSQDFTNVNWGVNGTASATKNTITAPDGTLTGCTVTGATDVIYASNNLQGATSGLRPVGATLVFSLYVKSAGATTVKIAIRDNGTGTITASSAITLTTSWQRVSVKATMGAATTTGYNLIGGADGDVYVWGGMQEDVTGQANQNPSEYVSVGVLSAPYHGAGVDGVQNFDTLNGNTVDAGTHVITEATGAPIIAGQAGVAATAPVDASGPLGYLAEGDRTNVILQSNTLGTTWTISHADDMNAVAADAYVSVDGATTMDKLQPKATTAVHSLDQAFTFTAAKYTTSADLRYVAATPQRWVALILNDGTTTWGASFDLLNGVVGAVSAGATSTIEATALAGVYRVSVTNTANAAAAAGTVKISLNATDTATLESAARAGTETLGAGMVQHEIGLFKSSRIITTTAAVTRNADVLTYPSAGNISGTQGTAYAEIVGADLQSDCRIIDLGVNRPPLYLVGTTTLSIFDGTSQSTSPPFTRSASVQKIASFWGGANMQAFNGGVDGVNVAFDGNMDVGAAITIGAVGGGGNEMFGTIRNLRLYPVALPAAKLQAMTTP